MSRFGHVASEVQDRDGVKLLLFMFCHGMLGLRVRGLRPHLSRPLFFRSNDLYKDIDKDIDKDSTRTLQGLYKDSTRTSTAAFVDCL